MINVARARVKCLLRHLAYLVAVVSLVMPATLAVFGQPSAPAVVSSVGYINGTPQTTHATASFNSGGASTLVAFVSSHPAWPWPSGSPVSITGLSDNVGNTWNLLTGPTAWAGSSYTLLSAIYYVNAPITSATHTVTIQLTNPAPLVVHIFAVSGSDISGFPIYSAIAGPDPGGASAMVLSPPISVGANTLLLGWVKNESGGTATALNGYTLDAQSSSYLWAESQTVAVPGPYTSQFLYDNAIGWQTAIVGLQPSNTPLAFSQHITTDQNTAVAITLTAMSPNGFQLSYVTVTGPTHGILTGTPPNLIYTPNAGYIGADSFAFKANDATGDSNVATVNIFVLGPAPTVVSSLGYINGSAQTTHTTATFNSASASTLVAFVSSHPAWPWPSGPQVSIIGLSDNVGNTWNLLTGPTAWVGSSYTLLSAIYYVNAPITTASHIVSVELTNPAPLVVHVFAVTRSDTTQPPIYSSIGGPAPGGASAGVTSAPISVGIDTLLLGWAKNEAPGTATALNGYSLDAQSTTFLWAESQTSSTAGSYAAQFLYDATIGWQAAVVGLSLAKTEVPIPSITATPASPTNLGNASFSFTDTEANVTFQCELDGGGFSTCSSPIPYGPLTEGSHTFAVEAQDASGNRSGAASFTWTVITTPPPAPTITSTPANTTNQASANFSFIDTQAGVNFLCEIDGSAFSACASPITYSGLSQGRHAFSVEAQDVAGNLSGATSFTWTITTTSPPVAFSQVDTTAQNTPLAITLTAMSPSGFQLTYATVTGPAHGALTGTAPNLTYTPNADYVGSDSFTFKANDTTADSNIATVSINVLGPGPAVVGSVGYDNPTPQTTHTTATFNSGSASTLVLFVGSHPAWPWPNGLSISIAGISDNVGNTWSLLTGPTTWIGSSFGLFAGVYYVNAPITGATHTVTVKLTNPAPLVMHIFAVAGSDTTGPPIYSAITDPGPGATSPSVVSTPISVGAGTLLLGWVKNENSATATTQNGYTLDTQSTSFLWAESQTGVPAGSYTAQFQFNQAVGWQTAIVGLSPAITAIPPPSMTATPANPTNQSNASFRFIDTEAGVSFLCQLDGGSFSACSTPMSYPGPLTQGSHTFSVKAQDNGGKQSDVASFTWTIITTPPPAPTITSTPANPTNQTSASFNFTDTQGFVSFLCRLDGSALTACASPTAYSGLSQGSHTFAVEAQDAAGNQSPASSFTWSIVTTPPPTPTITSTPANPTNQTGASFSFTDTQAGVSFLCQIDGSIFGACASPKAYSGLTQGSHTFAVEAQDAAGNQSGAANYTWTITTTPPPAPTITSTPANPTKQTNTSFSFTDTQSGVSFLCQLDGSGLSACASPKAYSVLTEGSHTFAVAAKDGAGNQSVAATFTWSIITTPPPAPTITATPANPTNQSSASFSFTDTQSGVSFLCQLDGSTFSVCATPNAYSGLTPGSHTFAVEAQDGVGNQSGATGFTWTVDTMPPPTPAIISTPPNPTNQTGASFSFIDTEGGVSFLCQLDGSAFSTCASPQTYSGLSQASHTFSVKAQDAAANQSAAASFSWMVDITPPPIPTITSTPANPSNQTSASFVFVDSESGVHFLCQLDGSGFSACSSPKTYSSLSQASHTFSVLAQDVAGNLGSAGSFTWIVDTTAPPKPTITSAPATPTNQTGASFSFTDKEAGVSLLCQLDASAYSTCTSPTTYSLLSSGAHTFSVRALDSAGNLSAAASFTWTIDTTPPPAPSITSAPANPTNQTSASFSFTDTQAPVSFLCQLDGGALSACASPKTYSGLGQGGHSFAVTAQDAAGNQSTATTYSWTISTVPPPTITSRPPNPTNQTSASFSFTDTLTGVSYLCQLDGSGFSLCSSPVTYSNSLAQGSHTFSVKAQNAAGNQSTPASYSWRIDTTPPPTPTITSAPTNPTTQTKAVFKFTDTETGVKYRCQMDGGAPTACSSPTSYSGLTLGSHTFSVGAQDGAGNLSAAASYTWNITR